jgi:hypothetical protein
MTKGNDDITSEIVQALIQARGAVIANTNNRADFMKMYLSDEAIAETYKTIFKAVNNPYDTE